MALEEVVVQGVESKIPRIFGGTPRVRLGKILVPVILQEGYSDTLVVTRHPVESGANIADHSYMDPKHVTLTCGWSNSGFYAVKQTVLGILATFKSAANANSLSGAGKELAVNMSNADYVSKVYKSLLDLQQQRKPFTIVTTMRSYPNMMIEALQVTRDPRNGNVLVVVAGCTEVIMVETKSTPLADQTNQQDPASTANVTDGGARSVTAGQPAPGGALPVE